MMTISELLARVKRIPVLYLSARRATLLEAYIDGFLIGRSEQLTERLAIVAFRDWLNQRPNVRPSGSMADVLIQLSGNDEAAYDEFFRLFDDFIRTHPVGILAPGDTEVAWQVVRGDGKKFIEYTKGDTIRSMEVDELPGVKITSTPF